MFVLQKVQNRFKVRGGRAIKMAAALCVAGLVAGVAGGVALAQVGGPNPVPVSEGQSVVCCVPLLGCKQPCQNYPGGGWFNPGSSTDEMAAGPDTNCAPVTGVTNNPGTCHNGTVPCGTIAVYSDLGCKGNIIFTKTDVEPACTQSPACS